MQFTILTLFPEMFVGPFDHSIIKRAGDKGIVSINLINIRDFATDKYKSVDDHPYGGGAGMVMRVDRALASIKSKVKSQKAKVILLDPQGVPYTQKKALELSHLDHLILLCGHYEGVDERIRSLVDGEISIGDYVTTGGEIPAMVIIDSVARLLPGVLKKTEATEVESFSSSLHPNTSTIIPLLEYPQYTRPEVYECMKVPDILLSGNHKAIEQWRNEQALLRTKTRRPDLLKRKRVTAG